MKEEVLYKRVVLKLSGEILVGNRNYGIDFPFLDIIAKQIKEVKELGVQLAISIGGGNIFRGKDNIGYGIDRSSADYIGMLATVMNALAFQDALERQYLPTRVQSALDVAKVAEPYIRRRAIRHLEKGRVLIFAAGTGNPFFSTDTAAALRAVEIEADLLMKGTKVDGVYSSDPMVSKEVTKFKQLSYKELFMYGNKLIDAAAISLCEENKLPLVVFKLDPNSNNIKQIILGKEVGTLIK
jgi:uridylate kinase